MKLNEPTITITPLSLPNKTQQETKEGIKITEYTKYMYYNDLFNVLDGFQKDGDCICFMILDCPKISGRAFAGIKPTVIIANDMKIYDKANLDIIDLKFKSENRSTLQLTSTYSKRLSSGQDSVVMEKQSDTNDNTPIHDISHPNLHIDVTHHVDSSHSLTKSNISIAANTQRQKQTKARKKKQAKQTKNFILLNKQIKSPCQNKCQFNNSNSERQINNSNRSQIKERLFRRNNQVENHSRNTRYGETSKLLLNSVVSLNETFEKISKPECHTNRYKKENYSRSRMSKDRGRNESINMSQTQELIRECRNIEMKTPEMSKSKNFREELIMNFKRIESGQKYRGNYSVAKNSPKILRFDRGSPLREQIIGQGPILKNGISNKNFFPSNKKKLQMGSRDCSTLRQSRV